MALWNRAKGSKEAILPLDEKGAWPWSQAQVITEQQAKNAALLPLGWYLYKSNYLWHGLKPNEDNSGFLRKYDFPMATDAEKWLEVPIPKELIQEEKNRDSAREKIAAIQAEQENQSLPETGQHTPPKPVRRNRNIDIHIKVSETEYAAFCRRLEETGMTQTNFLIQAALNSEIVVDNSRRELCDQIKEFNMELRGIRAEVGKIGGLLKMVIKPNEGQRTLNQDEWDSLIHMVASLKILKKKITRTMEAALGYFKTQ